MLAFTPTSLGDVTSGAWAIYFDGSDVGLGEASGEGAVEAGDAVSGRFVVASQTLEYSFELVSPALGSSAGGEIAVDPAKEGGVHSLRRVFDLELELDAAAPTNPSPAVFGSRAQVRFDLGATPLGWQWWLRLRQAFLERLDV